MLHADAHGARVLHGAMGDPYSSHAMSGGSARGEGLRNECLPAFGNRPLCGRPCAHRRSWRPPRKAAMGCENRKFVRKFVAIFWVKNALKQIRLRWQTGERCHATITQ